MDKSSEIFNETVGTLFDGMNGFISTKTVVGEAIHIGDTIIVPLVNVTFGVAAGAFRGEKKVNSGGGLGGKMTPSAVLVINNGITRMINVSSSTAIDKILDLVPDFVDKFSSSKNNRDISEEDLNAARKDLQEKIDESVNNVTSTEQ